MNNKIVYIIISPWVLLLIKGLILQLPKFFPLEMSLNYTKNVVILMITYAVYLVVAGIVVAVIVFFSTSLSGRKEIELVLLIYTVLFLVLYVYTNFASPNVFLYKIFKNAPYYSGVYASLFIYSKIKCRQGVE